MSMYNVQHFVLTCKYRKPYLSHPVIKQWCEHYIRHLCQLRKVRIIALAIMDEHVHLLVDLPRTCSDLPDFMRDLKWFTSYNIRRRFRHLRTEKALWGVRYFHRSVGGDRNTVTHYIKHQFGDKS